MIKEPSTGEMDCLVLIKKWHDAASMAGGINQTFDEPNEAWCQIVPVGGGIFFGSKQTDEGITHRVFTQYTDAVNDRKITAEHVIEHDNLRYRIKRASNLNGQRNYVMFEVELLGEFTVKTNFLLINETDRLLINAAGDHLIVN